MQIKIDVKILIIMLIFFVTRQLKIYVALMIFAFFHELAHVIVGVLLGFKVNIFSIKPLGFSVAFFNPIKDYNKKIKLGNMLEFKKIFVYLAGPLCNLIFALFFYFTGNDISCVYINLVIFMFNLIPIYPLDGGRILKSMVYIFYGLKNSYRITRKITMLVSLLLLFLCSFAVIKIHNIGIVIAVLYVVFIGGKSSANMKSKIKVYDMLEQS